MKIILIEDQNNYYQFNDDKLVKIFYKKIIYIYMYKLFYLLLLTLNIVRFCFCILL